MKKKYVAAAVILVIIIFALAVFLQPKTPTYWPPTATGDCVAEGECGVKQCCDPDMKQIAPAVLVSGGLKCEYLECGYICAYCGDGVCSEWENRCNCAEDC